MARRISLHDVRLPPNLLKDIDTELMVKLSEDDGSAFAEFLDSVDLEDLKNAQTKRQEMSDQVLQTAVINSEKEPGFEERKTQLRLKVLQMTDLKNDHNKRYEELKTLTAKGNYESVLKELQKSTKDTEKLSEETVDSYISGSSDLSLETFVSTFQEQRILYWLRKVKAEKMEQLLKNMRPVAAPRSPRPEKQHVTPPYVTPMPNSQPQSLPVPTPYHSGPQIHSISPQPDPRRMSNPTHSMPPYHPQHTPGMPIPPPGHPFPAAAFSSYPTRGTSGYPPPQTQRPPYPHPYGSYPANAY